MLGAVCGLESAGWPFAAPNVSWGPALCRLAGAGSRLVSGRRKHPDLDSQSAKPPANGAPAVWVTIRVPDNATPGMYRGELIASGKALLASGDRTFVDAPIDREKMSILLFTSGTTSMARSTDPGIWSTSAKTLRPNISVSWGCTG